MLQRSFVLNRAAAALAASVLAAMAAPAAIAAPIMPDFANVPTGWMTDRYAPANFSNVGSYQGRSDVLSIGISSAEAFGSRSPGFNSTFYNTQGKKHLLSGGVGSTLSADLYVNAQWRDGSVGNVRTDMWGTTNVPDYPIIGFTNYGAAGARFRVWDDDTANGWVDLVTAVSYDAWNAFAITFTGNSFEYYINEVLVYTDTTAAGSTGITEVIMQAYNFGGDPVITGANAADYRVHWSNTQDATGTVPEPATLALLGLAFGAAGWAGRQRGKR